MDPRRREIFMGVPAVRGDKEMSYEEQRVADYIKAYSTTGKPPVPCPQTPTVASERAALSLPPLFQPHVEVPGAREISPTSSTTSNTTVITPPTPGIKELHLLPPVQQFVPTAVRDGVANLKFHNIVCQATYQHFSPEELRHQAYLSGKKVAPEAISAASSSPQDTQPNIEQPVINGHAELFQSICCTPAFAHHSFEELRIACLRFGRELTSEEIQRNSVVLRLG